MCIHTLHRQTSVAVINVSNHCPNHILKHNSACYSITVSTIYHKAEVEEVQSACLLCVEKLADGDEDLAEPAPRVTKTPKLSEEHASQDLPSGGHLMESTFMRTRYWILKGT